MLHRLFRKLNKCTIQKKVTPSPQTILESQENWFKTWFNFPMNSGLIKGVAYTEIIVNKDMQKSKDGITIVLSHGYGLGSGMWAANIPDLAKIPKVNRIICFDWPGMGASHRLEAPHSPKRSKKADEIDPLGKYTLSDYFASTSLSHIREEIKTVENSPFQETRNTDQSNCKLRKQNNPNKTAWTSMEAISFFTDPVVDFFTELEIESCVLVGHSLGGYLSTLLSQKLSNRIKLLCLASPVGVVGRLESHPSTISASKNLPLTMQLLLKAWSYGFTAQTIPRSLPENIARKLIKPFARRVFQPYFGELTEEQQRQAENYLYLLTVAPPSGEYAMNSVLTLGYNMRKPLNEKLFTNSGNTDSTSSPEVSTQNDNTEQLTENDANTFHEIQAESLSVQARLPLEDVQHKVPVKTLYIYGEYDWLLKQDVIEVIANAFIQNIKQYYEIDKMLQQKTSEISTADEQQFSSPRYSTLSEIEKSTAVEIFNRLKQTTPILTPQQERELVAAFQSYCECREKMLECSIKQKAFNKLMQQHKHKQETHSTQSFVKKVSNFLNTSNSNTTSSAKDAEFNELLHQYSNFFIQLEKTATSYNKSLILLSGLLNYHGVLTILPGAGHHLASNNRQAFQEAIESFILKNLQTSSLSENLPLPSGLPSTIQENPVKFRLLSRSRKYFTSQPSLDYTISDDNLTYYIQQKYIKYKEILQTNRKTENNQQLTCPFSTLLYSEDFLSSSRIIRRHITSGISLAKDYISKKQ